MQACDKPDGIISLPYSIGVLYAYAVQETIIKENYRLCDMFVEKLDFEDYIGIIEKPDVFAFSCYIWNFEYNKQLAQRIKKVFPECVIIFGGHSIPINNSEMLYQMPYVDYLIHGEGEIPFKELLLHLAGHLEKKSVHNISYLRDGIIYYNYHRDCIINEYPSPYLTGVFDRMIDKDPEKRYSATIETNRGCPFHCAYCDWGLNQSLIRMMDLDKIRDEIEWMGRHKIIICNGADSNFGMFARDLSIAEKIAETREKYGYPYKFSVSFSKQSNEKVLKIARILYQCGVLAGATLSFQSLNPKTLEIIGRKNLSLDYFKELIAEYNQENIPTYSELILGLPGETYESFTAGVCKLIANGQYRYINVYDFALLVNSELGSQEIRNKYGIKTVKMPLKVYYCKTNNDHDSIGEFADIVVETSTMSRFDWVNCRMFTAIVKGFHSYGILLYVSSLLHQEGMIDYKEFYSSLCSWIIGETSNVYIELKNWYSQVSEGNQDNNNSVEFYNGIRIPPEEAAFLNVVKSLDTMYKKIKPFVFRYLDDTIPYRDELWKFQESVFRFFYDENHKNIYEEYNYDFISYFNKIVSGKVEKLREKRIVLTDKAVEDMLLSPKKIYIN